MTARRQRPRLALVMVLAIFCLPVLLAWVFHTGAGRWFVPDTVNRGRLVDPPVPLSAAGLQAIDGGRIPRGFFERHWTLVIPAGLPCNAACEAALYKTRQARHALGRDMQHVRRLLVAEHRAVSLEHLDAFKNQHPGVRLASAAPAWLESIETIAGKADRAPRVYLIDPRGNLMMFYPPDADADDLLEDLRRLLRVSPLE